MRTSPSNFVDKIGKQVLSFPGEERKCTWLNFPRTTWVLTSWSIPCFHFSASNLKTRIGKIKQDRKIFIVPLNLVLKYGRKTWPIISGEMVPFSHHKEVQSSLPMGQPAANSRLLQRSHANAECPSAFSYKYSMSRVLFGNHICVCICTYMCMHIYTFFFLLQLLLQHREVPGLGVKSELPLQPTPQSQQCEIQATSAIYATACSNTRSLTHWVKDQTRIFMDTMLGS